MAFELHTTTVIDGGMNFARQDRLLLGFLSQVAYPAGAGAGQSVSVVVTGLKGLPTKSAIHVNLDQDATYYLTARANGTVTVVICPRLATQTLAAGAFDLLAFA